MSTKNKGSQHNGNKSKKEEKEYKVEEHLGDPIPHIHGGEGRLTAAPTGRHIGNGCYVSGKNYFQ